MHITYHPDQQKFEAVGDAGEIIGEISYDHRHDNDIIVARHTFVSPEFRKQGMAQKLLDALVEYARQNRLRILPACPFVAAAFKRHPDLYRDVMVKPPPK